MIKSLCVGALALSLLASLAVLPVAVKLAAEAAVSLAAEIKTLSTPNLDALNVERR